MFALTCILSLIYFARGTMKTKKKSRDDEIDAAPLECCILRESNYKIVGDYSLGENSAKRVSMIVDTGAGLNLIHPDILPDDWQKSAFLGPDIHVRAANGAPLQTAGRVKLVIRVKDYVTCATFIVSGDLPIPIILGATFLDKHVSSIECRNQKLILNNGSEVPILRMTAQFSKPTNAPRIIPKPMAVPLDRKKNRVRLARPVVLKPGTQTWVACTVQQSGILLVSPIEKLLRQRHCSTTNGIIEVKHNKPFKILLANFSNKSQHLPKKTIIGKAALARTAIFPTKYDINEILLTEGSYKQQKKVSQIEEKIALYGKEVDELDLHDVPESRHKEIREMLRKHADIWNGHLGEIAATEHRIELVDGARPVRQQPYRLGPKQRVLVEQEIRKMQDAGVVQPSKSEWASPVVLVPKPDGSLRFCVDYRRLNALSVKDCYPIPRMEDCIDSLGEARYFTTLDANSGYWQITIAERDREKTAFTTHVGLYEYTRMPFGLTNAPATFQRSLDIILAKYKWRMCLIYLDDIVVFSKSIDDHIRQVDEVLQALRSAGVSLKFKKCKFFSTSINYLGHIIRPGRMEINQALTKSIREARPPENVTQLRSFLGAVNVYRRYIKDCAKITAPLNKLLQNLPANGQRKNAQIPIQLSRSALNSVKLLVERITTPPVLKLPTVDGQFSIDTDASADAIGCALYQEDEKGERHPVGFFSRSLNSAERNYSASERECLALVYGVTICRPYLQQEKFIAHTDHSALRWLMTISDPSGRLQRWRLRLSEFDFVVMYKKGKENTIADALSRSTTQGEAIEKNDHEIPCYLTQDQELCLKIECTEDKSDSDCEIDEEVSFFEKGDGRNTQMVLQNVLATDKIEEKLKVLEPITIEELILAQRDDPDIRKIRHQLARGAKIPFRDSPTTGALERVMSLDEPKVYVPLALRERLLKLAHLPLIRAHPGGRRMYRTLCKKYYWPGLAVDCYHFAKNCIECLRERVRDKEAKSYMKLFTPTAPLQDVAMDLLGPLIRTPRGNEFILIITDRFSKLVKAVPMSSTTGYNVARAFLRNWVFNYGAPRSVLTDNGKQFTSKFLLQVHRVMNIKSVLTTAYHPQTNGQCERYNRTMLSALRKYVGEHPKNWDEYTEAISFAYNATVHDAIGYKPFDLVLSHTPGPVLIEESETEVRSAKDTRIKWLNELQRTIVTAGKRLRKVQRRYQEEFDRKVRAPRKFTVNDMVFVRKEAPKSKKGDKEKMHKLSRRALGPFKITRVFDNNTVELTDGKLFERVNVQRLQKIPRDAQHKPSINGSSTIDMREVGQIGPEEIASHANATSKAIVHASDQSNSESNDYVIEKILRRRRRPKMNSKWEYRIKWFGYKHATWQPTHDLHRSTIAQFCAARDFPLPEDIEYAREG